MKSQKVTPKALQLSYKQFKKKGKSLTGMKIGQYIVYEKLGEGAFGAVFKGMDDKTKQEVAIKVLDLEAVEQEKSDYVKKIKRKLCKTESEMMLKCDSENLVKCYDIFQNRSLKIMIIEFCNGGELEHEINRNAFIPEKEAISILKQILNGLAELHNHGIIHRDLKPENILIHDGIYKIADFGFCKHFTDEKDEEKQLRQTKLGTISTMAPEVISSKAYGLKADIWSIGVIFYNMIYGKLPYKKLTYSEILREIENKNIFDPKIVGVCIQPCQETKNFISECLTIDSKNRLSWSEIVRHKIFEKYNSELKKSASLGSTFRRNVDLEIEMMKTLDKKEMKSFYHQKQEEEPSTPLNKTERPEELNKEELGNKRKQLTKAMSTIVFNWSKSAYFECMKTEVILNRIFDPIQSHEAQSNIFSSSENREVIEIMYLIIARCFNNMSFRNGELKKQNLTKSSESSIKDLLENIEGLYTVVEEKFSKYSLKLTKKESEILEVAKDKIMGILSNLNADSSDWSQEKEKYLTGNEFNENINNELYAYTKEEQIAFTQKYINKEFQLFQGMKLPNRVQRYLVNYSKICSLTELELGEEKLATYISEKIVRED